MSNKELWQPTKFIRQKDGRWLPNPGYVSIKSRLITRVAIESSEKCIREHATGVLLGCGCGFAPYYGMYRDTISDVICAGW